MSVTEDHDGGAAPQTPASESLGGLDVMTATDLASLLASRMCHDFISPASAIQSGLDLLDDPQAQDMRDDAMALISGSARKLVDLLQFSRAAFGGGAESYSGEELEALAKGVFAHHRGGLEWSMAPDVLAKAPARVCMNLCAVAAAALPMGGLAKIAVKNEADGGVSITADCAGPRARLRPELLAGLTGEGPGEGLAGHWIQAAWTRALVTQAGGRLAVTSEEGQVRLEVHIPG